LRVLLTARDSFFLSFFLSFFSFHSFFLSFKQGFLFETESNGATMLRAKAKLIPLSEHSQGVIAVLAWS